MIITPTLWPQPPVYRKGFLKLSRYFWISLLHQHLQMVIIVIIIPFDTLYIYKYYSCEKGKKISGVM